jgi:hypothetical protein
VNEYLHNEFVNERLAEHERRTAILLAQVDAQDAAREEREASCGAWCQVKRRTAAFRFAPRFN